jgi:large subunit ribosomal protein L6
MSRIGKLPVVLPSGVTVSLDGRKISVKGPKGNLERELPPHVDVTIGDKEVTVTPHSGERTSSAMHGLTRTLINNMVTGVSQGFKKTLDIVGVGYRVEKKKDYLVFTLGYSHPIYYELPAGLKEQIETPTRISVSGADNEIVGRAAAEIRSFRPPEPYKGKGVKYTGEVIRRKEGKSGAR